MKLNPMWKSSLSTKKLWPSFILDTISFKAFPLKNQLIVNSQNEIQIDIEKLANID